MPRSAGPVLLFALFGLHAGVTSAAPASAGRVPAPMLETAHKFSGDYGGNWNTELTDSDVDDISRYDLADSVMRLAVDEGNRLTVRFFFDPGAAAQNRTLDLLGFGCNSNIGPLLEMGQHEAEDGTLVTRATFDFDWGRCPSRVHSVATTKLHVELVESLVEETARREQAVRLQLLRKVQGDYQVYASVDGKRQPVEVRPKEGGGGTLYNPALEYCTQDEYGESTCVTQRSELKVSGAPVPLPGATVLWWTRKTPNLKVEKGAKLLYHEAVYTRMLVEE
jgi:hypothetical protein